MTRVGPGRWARGRAAVVAALALLLIVPPQVAVAQPSLDELRRERREAEQQQSQRQADLREAERRLNELESEFSLAVEEYNQAVERLEQIEARRTQLESSVELLRSGLRDRRARVSRLVRDLYKNGGRLTAVESLLGSSDGAETVQRYGYLRGAQRAQVIAMERYAAERAVLEREQADLDQTREQHAEVAAELDTRRADLEERAERQGAEIAALEASVERARQDLSDARSAERSEEQRLARVQREQEEQERQQVARASRSSGGEDSPSSPAPSAAARAPSAAAGAPSAAAAAAVQAALGQIGTRYQWGGQHPSTGFDCSGLAVWAYAQAGVTIRYRSTSAQFANLPSVPRDQIQPGDLLYYRNPVGHLGIYIGNGQMVEAPYSGQSVRVRSINRSDYRGARRPTG